jgi:hydroxyacylglutathione hydrolase
VNVLHTPGHSKGGVCYVLEEERLIFCGDTLFRLSVGRTDFTGGSPQELYGSIKNRLFALEGDYDVYPGHMRKTTLQFEREHNPFMLRWSPETW